MAINNTQPDLDEAADIWNLYTKIKKFGRINLNDDESVLTLAREIYAAGFKTTPIQPNPTSARFPEDNCCIHCRVY